MLIAQAAFFTDFPTDENVSSADGKEWDICKKNAWANLLSANVFLTLIKVKVLNNISLGKWLKRDFKDSDSLLHKDAPY